METVSSSTAINSSAKSAYRNVVVFSNFVATTQALLNSLQGSTTNYLTRPIGDISRVLGAVQNIPCTHANSPDSPATEAMLASMVEQWPTHHLSHLQLAPATCVEQSYVLE